MAQPADEAVKTRIILHMNRDHAFSLCLYARHYNQLPLTHAHTAQMDDITLSHLTLATSFGRLLIPLQPPLTSLAQARERLVAMHEECQAALGVSDVAVNAYRAPDRAWQWTLGAAVAAVLATFPFRAALHPDSGSWIAAFWSVGGRVRVLAQLAYMLQPVVLPVTLVIHVLEAVHMARSRLARYSVEEFSGVWWAWMLDCFVEGFGSFIRFDEMVKDTRERRGEAKEQVKVQLGREARERKAKEKAKQ